MRHCGWFVEMPYLIATDGDGFRLQWIVAQTQPRRQALAAEHIKRAGVEVYMPMFAHRETRHAPLKIQYLFGTYAFVQIEQSWIWLLGTIGVARVLRDGDSPAKVKGNIIARLKEREDRNGWVTLPVKPEFLVGQPVRLTQGHLEGRIAIYNGSDSLERERVLLNILGRQTNVSVGAGSLIAA
jgi:transcriptional antiterminator RfaH